MERIPNENQWYESRDNLLFLSSPHSSILSLLYMILCFCPMSVLIPNVKYL
uniref:Uncharacterized protein n=2 Tax=Picea TaxID=3328 RepID=A0A101M5B0_PICGL|nr:hypothetical protein ABT39_MTgene1055 [Picea glauca]QHR90023.1 hypothetical protein Q903MT_gene4046 [Picea sitchensis]